MSSDALVFDDELRSLEEQIQACLRAMDTLSGDARQDKYNRAQELLKNAQKTFHHFKVEIRQLDHSESSKFEVKCKQHTELIATLKEQLAVKRNEAPSAHSPTSAGSPAYGGEVDDSRQRARQKKDNIANTQQQSIKALERIERTVEDAKNVGDQTAQKLAEQTEQMHRMNAKLDKLDSEVDRGKAELNAFIRRMMTDKILLCFIVLIIVAVVAVVAIKLTNPKALSFDPPPPPPSTAAPPTAAPPPPPPVTPPPPPVTPPPPTVTPPPPALAQW